MIDGAESVTVALSGGADSVTLLSVLLGLKQELGINVSAAHLNHCLRGEESDRDEQFVRELCNRLDVPLVYEKADVKGFAERESLSIELAARKIRYEFLERVSDGVIATAHTANDNIETVLHNMVRGSGLKGICGIPPKRGRFIRPLLEVTREEIEQYCERNGLGYCIDSTNKNTVYTRNFIRHSVVPNLVEVNSNAIKNVSQMSKILRDDADYLNKTAANVLETVRNEEGLDVEGLKALHPAVASRCVALFYEQQVGKVPECTHVSSVLELLETNGKQSVQNDFFAVVGNGLLRFIPPVTHEKLPEVSVESLPFCYRDVKIYTDTAENFRKLAKFNSLLLNNAVDYDKICGILNMRGRMPGDAIRLPYRNCTKSLKKLFNESKTDEALRDSLAVASDENGIVWLQDFGVDSRVAIDDNTNTVLVFDISGSKIEGDNNE